MNERRVATPARVTNGPQASSVGRRPVPAGRLVGCTGAGQARELPDEQQGHGRGGHEQEQRAVEAEGQHESGHHRRPEREPRRAAHREDAHGRGAAVARDVAHQPRPLRMEGRDAHAADEDGQHEQRIAGGQPGKRHARAAHRHSRGHQPGPRAPVGVVAEQRLDDGGADRAREDQRGRRGVRQPTLANQEGEQGGHDPLRGVSQEVAAREHRQSAPVEALAHGAGGAGQLFHPDAAVTAPAANSTARISRRNSRSGSRGPTTVPSRLPASAPGSHRSTAV